MLTITKAAPADKPRLSGRLQEYLRELSAWHGDQPNQGGEYPYPWFDSYFTDPDRMALLLETEGQPAGFVLVNRFSCIGESPDHAIAEFCIQRECRGRGLGLAAAGEILQRYPGNWEIKYHRGNPAARGFWEKVTAPYSPKSTAMEEETVLSFTVNKEVLL